MNIIRQVNLLAGFVYSEKDDVNTTIHLVPTIDTKIPLIATKFLQGRGREPVLGPPFSVCLGFITSATNMTTNSKISQQKKCIEYLRDSRISYSDIFGASEFILPMLNGGIKSSNLAFTEAHKQFLLIENPSSKVRLKRYFI